MFEAWASAKKRSEVVEDWNLARIRLFVSVTGTANHRWTDAKQPRERIDYASYVGQDLLRCLAEYPSQTLTAR